MDVEWQKNIEKITIEFLLFWIFGDLLKFTMWLAFFFSDVTWPCLAGP